MLRFQADSKYNEELSPFYILDLTLLLRFTIFISEVQLTLLKIGYIIREAFTINKMVVEVFFDLLKAYSD